MMTIALLFPGQGSQKVGMGKALADAYPVAAATFREADRLLGAPLSRIMWEGPEDELVLTQNAQPAILVHSVAAFRVAQDRIGEVAMAAGHSLGEFAAHVVAGTLSYQDAIRAVRLRGELMWRAGMDRAGTMAAVLGMEDEVLEDLCRDVSASGQDGTVNPANFNSEGQVVISGDEAAVRRVMELAEARGARRVVPLSVSGAFHSPLMKPAEAGLRDGLSSVKFERPRFPVYSNVTAGPVEDGREARDLLIQQLTAPVRWAASIRAMIADGAQKFIEVGPGNVLVGLNRRNARGFPSVAVGEPSDLDSLGE